MADIGTLIRKEFGRIKADKRTLVLVFAIPLILIIIFGLTSGGGPTKFFTVSIITKDDMPTYGPFPANTSEYDEIFIDVVRYNSTTFDLYKAYNATDAASFEEAKEACIRQIRNEKIDLFIVLPENFSETVENNTDTLLIYYIDGSDMTALKAVNTSIQEPIALFKFTTEKYANFTMMIPYFEYDVPSWLPQVLNYAVPMILPMIILGLNLNMVALSIVSEGPLPRMLLTPTGKRDIIASKFIAYMIIMILQVTEILVTTAVFGLYVLGSLLLFYIILLLIGFCGVTMGLFISAISKTEQVANQMFMMFFIVIVMFSGQFIKSAPGTIMSVLVEFLPLGHAIPLLSDIALRGTTGDPYHILALAGIGFVFLIAAYIAYLFKKVEV